MNPLVESWVARIGDRFLVEAKDLLDVSDGYYQQRIRDGQAFNADEVAIAEWCAANLPPGTRVCEVGSGLGQLCLLLAALGFHAIGIDDDSRRSYLAERLAWRLGNSAESVFGEYPRVAPECDVLVTTNIVGGWWGAQPGSTSEKLRRFFYRPAVICPRLCWQIRETEEELAVFERELMDAGFVVDRVSDSVWYVRRT